jgi:hypothetical protein
VDSIASTGCDTGQANQAFGHAASLCIAPVESQALAKECSRLA